MSYRIAEMIWRQGGVVMRASGRHVVVLYPSSVPRQVGPLGLSDFSHSDLLSTHKGSSR